MLNDCPACGAQNRIPAKRLHQRAKCGKCKAELLPPHRPVAISSASDFEELIVNSSLPVLVDFWAPWCAPCQLVGPELVKVAEERRGRLLVAKVNTDEMPDIAQRYDIQGVPTFIAFNAGKETARTSGAQPASGILRELSL
jgi:thioredoxin 2